MDEQALHSPVAVQNAGDVGQRFAQPRVRAAGVVTVISDERQAGVYPQSAPDVGADCGAVGAPLVPGVERQVITPPGDLGPIRFSDGRGGEVDCSGVSQDGAGEPGFKRGADGEPVEVWRHEFQGGLEREGFDGE